MQVKNAIKLLRPRHWIKNVVIFFPAFFGQEITDIYQVSILLYGFFCFSIAASSIYILNDILDQEDDKLHPVKKKRPIASGLISTNWAYSISAILMFTALLSSYFITIPFFWTIVCYITINIFYSFGLKNISLLDILIVSAGFILRLAGGASISDITLSVWIILMTFLASMFLALLKRRDDVLIKDQDGVQLRKSLKGYNLIFIDQATTFLSALITVCYIMYIFSSDHYNVEQQKYLQLSTVLVIFGFLRYFQLAFVYQTSGNPVKILGTDRSIQLIAVFFVVIYTFILYGI